MCYNTIFLDGYESFPVLPLWLFLIIIILYIYIAHSYDSDENERELYDNKCKECTILRVRYWHFYLVDICAQPSV